MSNSESGQSSESGPENEAAGLVALAVDDTVCIGIGRCEMLEPDGFRVNDDAIAEVDGAARFALARAEEIVMECPSGAISIVAAPAVDEAEGE